MTPSGRARYTCIAILMSVLAGVTACTGTEIGTLATNQPKGSTTPSPQSNAKGSGGSFEGGVDTGQGNKAASPSPGTDGGATPTPAPTPTPRPSATPSPTAIPYTGFSVEVEVTPATASINLKDPDNPSSSLYSTKVTLSAKVLMSDNSYATDVVWSSSDESVATVSAGGVVTSGTKKGAATITATATDGQASGTSTITVRDDSALDVTID